MKMTLPLTVTGALPGPERARRLRRGSAVPPTDATTHTATGATSPDTDSTGSASATGAGAASAFGGPRGRRAADAGLAAAERLDKRPSPRRGRRLRPRRHARDPGVPVEHDIGLGPVSAAVVLLAIGGEGIRSCWLRSI